MRTAIAGALLAGWMVLGGYAAQAQAQYCDYYYGYYGHGHGNSHLLWEMQRQTAALRGIERAMQWQWRQQWASERARHVAELARIEAERDAQDRKAFDAAYEPVSDEAHEAVDRYFQHKEKGEKEPLGELVARRLKWKEYRRMTYYREARWGY